MLEVPDWNIKLTCIRAWRLVARHPIQQREAWESFSAERVGIPFDTVGRWLAGTGAWCGMCCLIRKRGYIRVRKQRKIREVSYRIFFRAWNNLTLDPWDARASRAVWRDDDHVMLTSEHRINNVCHLPCVFLRPWEVNMATIQPLVLDELSGIWNFLVSVRIFLWVRQLNWNLSCPFWQFFKPFHPSDRKAYT